MSLNGRRESVSERGFALLCAAAAFLPIVVLILVLVDVLVDGLPRLSWDFVSGFPSRFAREAGILPALAGSVYLVALTALIALPIGVGAAIYLEEYDPSRSRLTRLIEVNIANLAGVPSVIYGLLGLEIFVRTLGLGRSLLAGAATLALLVLPIVIVAAREALRVVPSNVREGGAALGATRWQVVWQLVLPAALPGILTGAILAISRAFGETAPLVVVGAITYVTFVPTGPGSPFTALPIQIFNWVSRPQGEFAANAAAAIVVMLLALLAMNAVAVAIRFRTQRRTA